MSYFDTPAHLDEYDLTAGEGGFFDAITGAITSIIPGPIDDLIVRGAQELFGGDEHDTVAPPASFGPSVPGSGPCGPLGIQVAGRCVTPDLPMIDVNPMQPQYGPAGQPVAGRYGMAMAPQITMRQTSRCPTGMVLGADGLCYNKRDLRKSERKWVPGRKPLFTGGDLNAITRAAKLEDRAKDIAQKMGFNVRTKAAAARDTARKSRGRGRRPAPAGITVVDTD